MPPLTALLVWLVLLLGLLYFDPAKDSRVSAAVWMPVIWMFIIGTRLPSQWLGGQMGSVAQAMQEGNPLDRTVDLILILLAAVTLISRSVQWDKFFARNFALIAFIGFALVSVFWSDFPFIAFKRWFRDLGNYFGILVVLTDPHPIEAARTLLRRLSYLVIPLCVMLIKYFPATSKLYDAWTGASQFTGATTSKNMLGVACLVSGIFFFWDTVTRWHDRKQRRTKRILLVNFALIGMTLWLLNLSSSATSKVCLAIGCLVILAAHSKKFQRSPAVLKLLIPLSFILYLVLAYGLDLSGSFAGAVGRDPTLTDRTKIWAAVLSLHTNPLVGTGYESFWLGPRLERIWPLVGHVNEAHNGYLDIYLNLGGIGLTLLLLFMIASYRKICKQLGSSPLASFSLALWTVMLFYDMTESAFRGGLLWITFLLAAIAAPSLVAEQTHRVRAVERVGTKGRFTRAPMAPTSFRK
jgi:exopolysaccharide production protein ExoQ